MATMVLDALLNGKGAIQSARMTEDETIEIDVMTVGSYGKIVRISFTYRKSHSEYPAILRHVMPLVPGVTKTFDVPTILSAASPFQQAFSGIENLLQRRRTFLAVLCPEAA